MGKIIAFANQKGGVGKTTSAVNVAASLGVLGKKVLLLDLDPQGNTTSGVGVTKRGLVGSTKELLNGEMTAKQVIRETPYENLWVIPANTTLTSSEFELFDFDDNEFRMKKALEEVADDFDYILIDCSPSLGLMVVNALTAADSVIIPVQCEYFALEGISKLLDTIRIIKRKTNPSLSIEGFLLTMYDSRLRLANQIYDEVKRHFQELVFKTVIQRNVKLSEAPSHGLPVILYDADSTGAKNHLALAKEIISKNQG